MKKSHLLIFLSLAILITSFTIGLISYSNNLFTFLVIPTNKHITNTNNNNNNLNNNIKLFNMILDDSVYGLNNNSELEICKNNNTKSIRYLTNLDCYITLENPNLDEIYDMYIIRSNNEKKLLCNNITKDNFKYFTIQSKGNLYYLNNNKELYYYNKEEDKQTKIESDVCNFSITNNEDIVINTSDVLYVINAKGAKKVLSSHGKCKYFYLNDDNIVYVENSQINYYNISNNHFKIIEKTSSFDHGLDIFYYS